MVNYQSNTLDATFGALADPTRRAILARLALGEATVGELADPFEMSLPAVSKHLKVLERAGLVARQRDGRLHRCRFEPQGIAAAADWIREQHRFWQDRFDGLEKYLEEKMKEETDDGTSSSGHRVGGRQRNGN